MRNLLIAVVTVWGCSSRTRSSENPQQKLQDLTEKIRKLQAEKAQLEAQLPKEKTRALAPVPVLAVRARKGTLTPKIEIQGQVDNKQSIILSAKSPGSLVRFYVQEGQYVPAGALLAEQESQVLRKNLQEIQTRLELADTLYQKQKRLYAQNATSEVQYLTAKSNKEALEATLATLQEQLRNTQLRAPFAGVVDAFLAKQGEMLLAGMPILRLVSRQNYEITAEIPENFAAQLTSGTQVEIYLPDVDKSFQAPIATLSENINPISRSFTLRVKPLPSSILPLLKPNMIAFVRIPQKSLSGVWVIPSDALLQGEKGYYLLRVQDGQTEKVPITVLQTYRDQVAVEGALNPNDTIITLPPENLTEGMPVTIEWAP
ncbi:MAG: efflux RND transporter periplasmic adaptor subunit [Bacteroidia bacterium]